MNNDTQRLVSCLLEEVESPFSQRGVLLQYVPFKTGVGDWQWYWVLLPPDRDKALATGQEVSRHAAGTKARLKARELGLRVSEVEVLHPSSSEQAL